MNLNISLNMSQPQKGGLVRLYIHHSLLFFVCIFVDSISIGTIMPSPLSLGTAATGKSIIVYYGL